MKKKLHVSTQDSALLHAAMLDSTELVHKGRLAEGSGMSEERRCEECRFYYLYGELDFCGHAQVAEKYETTPFERRKGNCGREGKNWEKRHD